MVSHEPAVPDDPSEADSKNGVAFLRPIAENPPDSEARPSGNFPAPEWSPRPTGKLRILGRVPTIEPLDAPTSREES